MKQAEIAINIIIIAAICLVVLIIVIAIFGSNIKKWGSGIADCRVRGGSCVSRDCVDADETEVINTDCKEPSHCCVRILGES